MGNDSQVILIRLPHNTIVFVQNGAGNPIWITILKWEEPDPDEMFGEWCDLFFQDQFTWDDLYGYF